MFSLNSSLKSGSYLVSVMNTVGQVVFESKFNSLNNQSLDLSTMPAGQYFVKVISDAGVNTQSISIVK